MVVPSQRGRGHAAHGHAGLLRKQIAKTEVVDVPSRHVVVDVGCGSSGVVHHKANLDVGVDVVGQVNGDGGPAGRVLSGGGGACKPPVPGLSPVAQTGATAGDPSVPVRSL